MRHELVLQSVEGPRRSPVEARPRYEKHFDLITIDGFEKQHQPGVDDAG